MSAILIIEDQETNLDMLTRRLARAGFQTLDARTGGEGLEAARAHHPALILMDLSLPDMDGREATRRLKADPATAAIPVIALTAHAMDSDRASSLAAGCDDFDTKPVDIPRLLGKIRRLMEGSHG